MRDKQRTDEGALLQKGFLKAGLSVFVRATRPSKRKLTRGLSSMAKCEMDWPWLVLFVLARIDWVKGIGQVLASVVEDVQVGTSGM